MADGRVLSQAAPSPHRQRTAAACSALTNARLPLHLPSPPLPPSQDCVHKTLTRIENKLVNPRVLSQCTYMLRSLDRTVQQRVAIALARHVPAGGDLVPIFVDKVRGSQLVCVCRGVF